MVALRPVHYGFRQRVGAPIWHTDCRRCGAEPRRSSKARTESPGSVRRGHRELPSDHLFISFGVFTQPLILETPRSLHQLPTGGASAPRVFSPQHVGRLVLRPPHPRAAVPRCGSNGKREGNIFPPARSRPPRFEIWPAAAGSIEYHWTPSLR